MGKWTGTIIGGGIGWALFGPLGALVGAYLGSLMSDDRSQSTPHYAYTERGDRQTLADTRAGDFAVAMLALFAHISKADQTVKSSEVQYVKKFLIEKFGKDNAQDLLYLYREILNRNYSIQDVASQIRTHMDYYLRMELLHVLFGIAAADGEIKPVELDAIKAVADHLGIYPSDLDSIKAIFIPHNDQAYAILNISRDADIETIKKAYRELATKYHPDKVVNLGPEIQKLAEEKFKAINEAYQAIRKERGF
jgi:DnaJ like chaperone protein